MDTRSAELLRRAKEPRRVALPPRDEVERVMALPRDILESTDILVRRWTEKLRRHPAAPPLRPAQALILEKAYRMKQRGGDYGTIGHVGVGKGKTLAFALLAGVLAPENGGKVVLLIPPDMRAETEKERALWAKHYDFPEVEIVAYSILSRPDATDLLERLAPGLILADECQALKRKDSARTKRFIRYFQSNPRTRFVAMSGTLTARSVRDYAHLAEIALRDFCPLPIVDDDLATWAGVMDHDVLPPSREMRAKFKVYVGTEEIPTVAQVRAAFQKRLASAPGFLVTTTPSTSAKLEITAVYPPVGEIVQDALYALSRDYELPNGDLLTDAVRFAAAAHQLSAGFYYVPDWPRGPDLEWLDARSEWSRQVREYLNYYSGPGRDSPFLVETYVRTTHTPSRMWEALQRWDEQRHKPEPPRRACWIDTSLLAYAVEWAQAHAKGGIIWFRARAVGEALAEYGIPTYWEGSPDFTATPVVALSIAVYHKGRNFQEWGEQLLLEVPTSAERLEQLFGRTHRQGQKRDVVRADVVQHTWKVQQAWASAVEAARYIQATTGQEQKILAAGLTGFGR